MDTAWYNPGNASCVPGRAHWNASLTHDITDLSLVSPTMAVGVSIKQRYNNGCKVSPA